MSKPQWMIIFGALLCCLPTKAQEPPVEVQNLLLALPFQLEKPYRFDWRAERPLVESGYVLVLEVTPLLPKQSAEPVLFVGKQTAERVNTGYPSGRVVVIVPSSLKDVAKADYLDLNQAPMWFGDPDLPERITQAKIEQAFERAQTQGAQPFETAAVEEAIAAGGSQLNLESKEDLLRVIADLIAEYSPEEKNLIQRLRP